MGVNNAPDPITDAAGRVSSIEMLAIKKKETATQPGTKKKKKERKKRKWPSMNRRRFGFHFGGVTSDTSITSFIGRSFRFRFSLKTI